MNNEAEDAEDALEIANLVDERIDARMFEEFAKRPVKMEFRPEFKPEVHPSSVTVQVIKQETPDIHMRAPEAVVRFEEARLSVDPSMVALLSEIKDLLKQTLEKRAAKKVMNISRDQNGWISQITIGE